MLRRVAKKPKPTSAHATIPSTTRQAGTKESPILLLSDDESEGKEDTRRPLATTQKTYLGVSPSDPYTFRGHGSAYDIMIAMGYKPDRGLGLNLRGNVQPLPIELRKPTAGVGYHTTSVSRSPSPAPPPRKAPVKIIRPPREPVASTSKIERSTVKVAPRTSSQLKPTAEKSTSHNPPKQPSPTQQLSSPLTVVPPSSPSSVPFVPSDLYLSLMSGLAMANMPQTMQVAAAADPMAAFQLAQMYFTSPSPFPLPPFSLVPPQPDPAPVHRNIRPHNLPPKPVFASTTNPKIATVSPPLPSPVLQEVFPDNTPPSTLTDPPSVTIEMGPLELKQIRQARKNNLGWIPEPGFPGRGTFNLVPTIDYAHWSSSDDGTPPDPHCSLVMEDLPCNCRTLKFVRSWADQFSATAVYLNGGMKALIEFPSREMAEVAYDSPRLRGGPFKRATHVRVFWYRPQSEDIAPSSNGSEDAIWEGEDSPDDKISANIVTALEEPTPMVTDDLSLEAEATEAEKGAQLTEGGKGTFPSPPDTDLPVRPPTAPPFTSMPGPTFAITPSLEYDQGEQRQPGPVDQATLASREGSNCGTLRLPGSLLPSASAILHAQTPPHLHTSSPEATQRKPTPPGSPPSLRYPSPTPETINDKEREALLSEDTPMDDITSPTSTSDPPVVGDYFLEQQLRMRLLAVKRARISNRSYEPSSSSSTSSTVADHDSDTFFKTASPPPRSGVLKSVGISESLELLATSFIDDTIQAVQGSPSEPERHESANKAQLSKKRGFNDAFGSSADIAFRRQQLTRQIEESKKIMKRWKAAKTKEERNQIYTLWEESNRSAESLLKPASTPFQWPCYAESCLIIDSDDEDDMDLS